MEKYDIKATMSISAGGVIFVMAEMGIKRINILMASGRKDFQVRYIRWSYRMRGYVARIQINKKLIKRV